MKFCSMFSQLLPLFSRVEFQKQVQASQAERHARGFASWDQFVSLMFCQLGHAYSLREITGGLASCEGKLNHLGMKRAPSRATLAYANEHRPYQLFEKLFGAMLGRVQHDLRAHQEGQSALRKTVRIKNQMISLDASVIDLCIAVFDWAKFRRTKGAVKLHMQLDHEGCLPRYVVITEGKTHEITVARNWQFEADTVLVFDKGFTDYDWYGQLCERGVWWVTRLKDNAVYEVVEERTVPQRPRHQQRILRDETIRLSGTHTAKKCPHLLRRIEVEVTDDKSGEIKVMVFLTNNLKWGATTVAAIYKERWQIESFFRMLKQTLKVKTFLGTSANAVKTQIWTALIAILLLRYLQLKAKFGWSLSGLAALLRMNLFVHRDLWAWLDQPYAEPPPLPQEAQLRLDWAA
jgi:hypothetical protein